MDGLLVLSVPVLLQAGVAGKVMVSLVMLRSFLKHEAWIWRWIDLFSRGSPAWTTGLYYIHTIF